MRLLVLACAMLTIVGTAQGQTSKSPGDARPVIAQWHELDDRCGSGAVNDRQTLVACSERETIGLQLEAMGFCSGAEARAGDREFWLPCAADRQKETTTSSEAVVPACNIAAVTSIIIDNTLGLAKREAQDKEGLLISTFFKKAMIRAEMVTASARIENIRQVSYDKEGNTRTCRATYKFDHTVSLETGLFMAQVKSPPCANELRYKIEVLLDKPGQFYVSWVCLK